MKVSNKEFFLIMLSALLFALCFILFGSIVGHVSFEKVDSDEISGWIGALGSVVAGISTLGLLIVAPRVVADWRARQKVELTMACKKDIILSQEFMYKWLDEAMLCSKPPREDSIAIQIKSKLDAQMQSALANAAHWDALQAERSSWLMDDILKVEREFSNAYREANSPFYYKAMCKDANGKLKKFNEKEQQRKRNSRLVSRKKNISTISNSIIGKLDGFDK
ncbi:hypothetical protein QNF08_004432 [Vibrio vulnificus]|nr:hypothetical protein [Vibrio vulnificus]ELV8622997.1 hypothetical protein [Vibrio vulnificus]ELV8738130.1 hypothetical protein [Vibrio vulnificus]HAS8196798.1 hypothetical protein [Vibrio vulnificus]HAS8367101.1 hypothetical protein [Vibrio vulnificus]